MNLLKFLIPFSLVLSSLEALAPVPIYKQPCQPGADCNRLPELSLSYTAGKTIGIDKNYASIGLFYSPLPYWYDVHPFVDLSAYRMSNNLWAASAGAGVRIWCDNRCAAIGFNGFYDFRESNLGDFHQAGFGFEYLSPTWVFTLNGYIPFKNKFVGPSETFDEFTDDSIFVCTPSTTSLKGGDFEFGRNFGCNDLFLFYAGIGSYYYHKNSGNTYGLKLRGSLQTSRYFSLEGIAVYDKSCHALFQLTASLYIPFDILCGFFCGCAPPCDCDDFMMQRVNRNDMILLENRCCWTGNF
jgi:hypothetical protein